MRQVPQYLIIGQGRVARHFRQYLSFLNIPCQLWHRGLPVAQLREMVLAATHILVLISDGAIEGFIKQHLHNAPGMKIHFSGALVTNAAFGAHPLMTFGETLYSLGQYKNIPFIVDEGAPAFSALLPGLPNPHFTLNPAIKPKYHALCVMAGNFSCLLWQKFFSTLESEFKIPAAAGKVYLQQQTENLSHDYKSALTGPLARGDTATVEKNLTALEGDAFHRVYEAFVAAYQQEKKS